MSSAARRMKRDIPVDKRDSKQDEHDRTRPERDNKPDGRGSMRYERDKTAR